MIYALINDGYEVLSYVARGLINGEMIEPMIADAALFKDMDTWVTHVKMYHTIDKYYKEYTE